MVENGGMTEGGRLEPATAVYYAWQWASLLANPPAELCVITRQLLSHPDNTYPD